MKNKFKMIFAFILGIVISGTVVYASGILARTVTYDNSVSNLKDSNGNDVVDVQTAIDILLDKAENVNGLSKRVCTYVSEGSFGQEGQIGAKYSCDPGDGVLRNFYILAVDTNKVKLIMDRNITQGSSQTIMTWMNAMKYFRTGAGAATKAAWTNVIDVDLPSAQTIANAVGNTSWNMEDKDDKGWFYFDKNGSTYGQTQVANDSNLSNYRWLYNYTRECSAYGCDSATSLGSTEAIGYWTRDIVAQNSDTTCPHRTWFVRRHGYLRNDSVSNDTAYGVRPVITILKSNLY